MAITMRRGNFADFDPTKMQTGEWAVCLDNGYVYMTLSPGNVIKLGTADSIEQALALAQQYVSQASASATSALTSKRNAEAWAVGQKDGTDVPSTDPTYHNNAKYWAEQAAQSSGAQPATPTSPGIVQPDNTSVTVDENGIISALDPTARTDIATINGKIGANNGIASLDNSGKVPSSQLPGFVDDVIEGYYKEADDRFYEESTFETLITPVEGKSWVDKSTNKSYRWTGSVYVRVDEGVQLGETSDTAYAGNKGKANADAIADINSKISATASSSNLLQTANEVKTSTYSAAQAAEILTRRTQGHTGKNLLHVMDSVVSTTIEGITYTITRNDEGEVTQIELNGTASADSVLDLNTNIDTTGQVTGAYNITGFENSQSHLDEYAFLFERLAPYTYKAYIIVYSGVTVSNLICQPMVRDTKFSATFEPYHAHVDNILNDIKGLIPSNASVLNKLATVKDIPSVDQTYDGTSTNAQSGTAVAEAISPITAVIPSGASSSNKVVTEDDVLPFTTAQINALKALV